jgi:hypothetical protein
MPFKHSNVMPIGDYSGVLRLFMSQKRQEISPE